MFSFIYDFGMVMKCNFSSLLINFSKNIFCKIVVNIFFREVSDPNGAVEEDVMGHEGGIFFFIEAE
jgi:hypothetical protein